MTIKCIGFGEYEGKCKRVHDGALNPVWCDRCNALRIAHLNERFAEIAAHFPVENSQGRSEDA